MQYVYVLCFSYRHLKALKPEHKEMEKEMFMLALLFESPEMWVQRLPDKPIFFFFFGLVISVPMNRSQFWAGSRRVFLHLRGPVPFLILSGGFMPFGLKVALIEMQGEKTKQNKNA